MMVVAAVVKAACRIVLVVCSDLVVFYARKIGHLKYGLS